MADFMARSHKSSKRTKVTKRTKVWTLVNSAIFVALVGITVPYAIGALTSHGKPFLRQGPQIEVDDVRVQDSNGSSLVTVLLRNTGHQVAIIKSAQFYVRRAAHLSLCMAQGSLESTATYGLTIPRAAQHGTTLHKDVSQQEAPDSADRFSFRMRLPVGHVKGISFYEMAMTLSYDKVRRPVDVGTLLITLPTVPDSRFIWTKGYAATHGAGLGSSSQIAELSQCLVGNSKAIAPMLKSSATRSRGVSGLGSTIAYCCVLADTASGKGA